ncbi:MAG: hypothetical protein HYY34_06095 [Chloroflexi bacterium]|nr:hypothetical protein [Chloroflexota bacterium]
MPSALQTPGALLQTPEALLQTPAALLQTPVALLQTPVAAVKTVWAKARLEAVKALWNPSQAGREWMDAYDFRQMVAQPAWFGSTGFSGYAGAGQAIPRIIMHEMSHSMWGAFPVAGRPDLTGEQLADGALKVVAAYREDLATFLRQPPDRFEPLRDRFRNMPNLTAGDYPDLHHFGEADMVSMTGADLSLVPPILRKYLDAFYGDGAIGGHDFADWEVALRWWNDLGDADRHAAGEVFGLQHFPLDAYRSLRTGERSKLPRGMEEVLAGEERQRLIDFAEQLDEVKQLEGAATDAAGVNRGFDFWRGYLIEIKDLHRKHPETLRGREGAQARQIGSAFDFYLEVEPLGAEQQAERYLAAQNEPFVSDFPFLLKARALVRLFAGVGQGAEASEEIGGIVAGYAKQLAGFAREADEVVAAAHRSPSEGGARLEKFLAGLSDDDVRSSLGTVLDLMREDDRAATGDAMRNLSVPGINRLLELRPEIARSGEIAPGQLLATVNVVDGATRDQLIAGVSKLVQHSSGNFAIDRPYDEAVFALLDSKARNDPALVRDVFRGSGLRVLPWIEGHGANAASVFASDPRAAAKLIFDVGDLRNPAPMLLHALVVADPEVAARVVAGADALDAEIVARFFNQFVYDVYWADLRAGPKVDLSADATFLSRIVALKGPNWALTRIAQGVSIYRAEIERGELEAEYLARHAALLQRLQSLLPQVDPAAALLRQITALLPR